MSIRSCTRSSNMTDFLLIRQEFVFFIKSGRKGLRYPCLENCPCKLFKYFGKMGWYHCETFVWWLLHKTPRFRHSKNRKMVFRCDEILDFLLQNCSSSQDARLCTIWSHYQILCRDSTHNIGRLS